MEKQRSTETLPVSTTINQLTISRMLRREITRCIDKFLQNANKLLMDGEKTKDGFDKNFFISFLKQYENEILNVQNKLLSGGMNIKNFGKQLSEFLKQMSEKGDSAQEIERLNTVVNHAKDEIDLIALILKEIAAGKEFDEIDLPPNLEKTYNSLKERFEAEKIDTTRIVALFEKKNSVISGVLDVKIAEIKESIKKEINTAMEMAVTNIYDYIHEKIEKLSKAIDGKIDESRKNTYASFEINTGRISTKFNEGLSKTAQEIIGKVNELLTREETKAPVPNPPVKTDHEKNKEEIAELLRKWIERNTKPGKTRRILVEMAKSDLKTEFTHEMIIEWAVSAGIISDTKETKRKLHKDLWTLFAHVLSQTDGEFVLKKGMNEQDKTCYWYEMADKPEMHVPDPFTSRQKMDWVKTRTSLDGNSRKLLREMVQHPLVTKFTSQELSKLTGVKSDSISSYLKYIVKSPKGILIVKYRKPFWWLEENKVSEFASHSAP